MKKYQIFLLLIIILTLALISWFYINNLKKGDKEIPDISKSEGEEKSTIIGTKGKDIGICNYKCCKDEDCGIDSDTENYSCTDRNIYRMHLSYNCLNPTTLNAECSETLFPVIYKECNEYQKCKNNIDFCFRDHSKYFIKPWGRIATGYEPKEIQRIAFRQPLIYADIREDKNGYETGGTAHELKAINPELIILVYRSVSVIWSKQHLDWEGNYEPNEDWFLHDEEGNRITYPPDNKTFLMDPASPGWRLFLAEKIRILVEKNGLDGVFLDTVDPTPWVNWANNQPPQEKIDSWENDTLGLLKFIKDYLKEDTIIIYNRIHVDWRSGKLSALSYLDYTDGASIEQFMHNDRMKNDEYPSEEVWKGFLSALTNITETGKISLTLSYSENYDKTKPGYLHLQEFAFTSFLLGADENSYFAFNYVGSRPRDFYFENYDVDIGIPSGNYYVTNNLYQRDFSKGKVVVNPTDNASTINFHSSYKTLDGEVITSLTLEAHTGIILLKE